MDFIKNIFAGIIGFFQNLFGIGKSEYFLEIDESDGAQAAPKAVKVGTPEPAAIANPGSAAKTAAPAQPKAAKPKATKSRSVAAPPTTPSTPSTPEELIAAAVARVKTPTPEPEVVVKGFASDFGLLMSNQNGRRLPGPSMNSFREMARQSKIKIVR